MRLLELRCRDFRCLKDVRLTPAPGINVVRGLNGHGKTSLVEALLFAATSKSHRTSAEIDLVARGQDGFRVQVRFEGDGREQELEANWWKGVKRFKVNGVPQIRVSDILGKLTVVLFSPEDLVLVKGSAAHRRKFLDMELSQLHQGYLSGLQQYRHVLRQRNELLRRDKVDGDQLDVWDEQLARHGALIVEERSAYVAELSELAAQAYRSITPSEELTISYQPDVTMDESFSDVLRANRDKDIRRQMTVRGPHRDDLYFSFGPHPVRSHGSQGQQKTAALSVRLAEMELVKKRKGEYPVLMLDDVLSELDERRSRELFSAIPEGVQCLLTTTETTMSETLKRRGCKLFQLEEGRLIGH